MNYLLFYCLTLCIQFFTFELLGKAKIIGLMQVRNEEAIIEQSLQALAYYVDSIIILDDHSTDQTKEKIKNLSLKIPLELLIENSCSNYEQTTELHGKQTLLEAGRSLQGTHFVLLDADEIFSFNCHNNNFLKQCILSLEKGQTLQLQMIHPWKSCSYYRDDYSRWSPRFCWTPCAFCDDKQANYTQNFAVSRSGFTHVGRTPLNLISDKPPLKIDDLNYNIIHFRFANWRNILIKRAWYMCLEYIRSKETLFAATRPRSVHDINFFYTTVEEFTESESELKMLPAEWLSYPFFNENSFMQNVEWRKKTVQGWIKFFGKDFFKDLDIWNINWFEEEK